MGTPQRRAFGVLALILLSTSGSFAAEYPTAISKSDWSAILQAARGEGVVLCGCPPRPDFSRIIKEGFEAAYGGIRLEATAAPLPEFPIRVGNEQKAGKYLWDVYMFGPGPEVFHLKNQGGFEPLRGFLVLPEVLDESVWREGLNGAFLDLEKKYIFAQWYEVSRIGINRKKFPNVEIKDLKDLLNSKFRGEIVWQDPRAGGAGSNSAALIYSRLGREGLKKLLIDQKALLVKGTVQLTELIVRGVKGISIPGPPDDALVQYHKAGMKLDYLDTAGRSPRVAHASVGGSTPAVFKNPPHPNATKAFINWTLSRQGQALLSKKLNRNSQRKDVPVADPNTLPLPGEDYLTAQTEQSLELRREAMKIARELVP